MSQENVKVAQSGIDAWNRADLSTFIRAWHRDCEWRPAFPKGTEGSGSMFRGHDGITRAWKGVRAVWEEYRLDVEDARPVGDALLVLGRIYARAASSGIELESDWSAVLRFRDGKVVSAWDWLDHRSALEAVGLRE